MQKFTGLCSSFGLITLFTIICLNSLAQNVGIGTNTPHASAQLDISSTNKGILVPRMTMAQRNAINAPAKGLMVFVNDDSSFYYFAGASWQKMTTGGDNWLLTGNDSGTGRFLGTKDTSALRIITKNKEKITIDSAGRIGMNNPNPEWGLHMVDNGSGSTDLFVEYNRNDGFIPSAIMAKSNGTFTDKLGVDSGKTIGRFGVFGYSKSPAYTGYLPAADIFVVSRDTFAYPNYRADIRFVAYNRSAQEGNSPGLMAFTHQGNLGVGTFTPDVLIDARSKGNDLPPLFQLANKDQSHRLFFFGGRENDPNPFIQVKSTDPLRFATDENGFREMMRINPNGRVGIATGAPEAILHVNGESIMQASNEGNIGYALKAINTAFGFQTVGIGFSVAGDLQDALINMKGAIAYQRNNSWGRGDLLFLQNSDASGAAPVLADAKMVIKNNGNVGIGTTTPNASLQLSNIINNRRLVLWEDSNNDHQYYGFGINASTLRYQVPFTGASHIFYAATGTTTSNQLMRIQGNGNVGIGVATATERLHVNGNIRVANDASIFGLDQLVGFNDLRFYGDPIGGPDFYIGSDGRSGFTNTYSNVSLNVRGITGDPWFFSVENPAGSALFDVLGNGNVSVTNTLSKGGGSFKIDHPLDPENKYLYHSFVESPDMMNVYNGNITTDASGTAVVAMPEWFDALNRDFRYQLTVIGEFAQAIVGEKMRRNKFTIKTDKPNVEVSWQVTGIRKDAWANQNRIPVEEAKAAEDRGHYLHPAAFGRKQAESIGKRKLVPVPELQEKE